MWSYKAPDELHHPTSSNPVLFHDAVIAIERLKNLKIQIFPEPSFFLAKAGLSISQNASVLLQIYLSDVAPLQLDKLDAFEEGTYHTA